MARYRHYALVQLVTMRRSIANSHTLISTHQVLFGFFPMTLHFVLCESCIATMPYWGDSSTAR
jgi:hypothetical protein